MIGQPSSSWRSAGVKDASPGEKESQSSPSIIVAEEHFSDELRASYIKSSQQGSRDLFFLKPKRLGDTSCLWKGSLVKN